MLSAPSAPLISVYFSSFNSSVNASYADFVNSETVYWTPSFKNSSSLGFLALLYNSINFNSISNLFNSVPSLA